MADKDNEEVELTIADEAVVTKYKTAGEIANRKWSFVSMLLISPNLLPNCSVVRNRFRAYCREIRSMYSPLAHCPTNINCTLTTRHNVIKHNLKTCNEMRIFRDIGMAGV